MNPAKAGGGNKRLIKIKCAECKTLVEVNEKDPENDWILWEPHGAYLFYECPKCKKRTDFTRTDKLPVKKAR